MGHDALDFRIERGCREAGGLDSIEQPVEHCPRGKEESADAARDA